MTTVQPPIDREIADRMEIVDSALRTAVGKLSAPVRRVCGYHFGWWDANGTPNKGKQGKAFRPALVLAAAEAVGGDPLAAVPGAVAVELVHNFSLLHDDVMDQDRTRRHQPAAWCVFGTGEAILAGDALHALAYEVLLASKHPKSREALHMIGHAVLELVRGQAEDLAFEQRADVRIDECVQMAEGKTAALLAGATGLGALLGGGARLQVELLSDFGRLLGLAFQHVDDLLGIWGAPDTTGKPVLSDLRNRKKSLPVVAALHSAGAAGESLATRYLSREPMTEDELQGLAALVERRGGREWSRQQATHLLDRARNRLSEAFPTQQGRARLLELAEKLVHRDH